MTRFGLVLSVFIVSCFAFLGLFAFSLNLPVYYELRFPVASDINSEVAEPIFIGHNALFQPVEQILSHKAIVKTTATEHFAYIYSAEPNLLKSIEHIYKLHIKDQVKATSLKLEEANKEIDRIKESFLQDVSLKQDLAKQAAVAYFNSLIQVGKNEQSLALIAKVSSDNIDVYLTIPAIIADPVVQKLKLSLVSDLNRAEIEDELHKQILLDIELLKNQLQVNKQLSEKFLAMLHENIGQKLLKQNLFIALQKAVEQKIMCQEKLRQISLPLEMPAILHPYKMYENLCYYLLVGLGFFIFLMALVLLGETFKRPAASVKHKFIRVLDLVANFKKYKRGRSYSIAFFAEKSEVAAAKFILQLRQQHKKAKIILLDFGNKVTVENIDQKAGLGALLCNDAALENTVFTDEKCQIDILYGHDLAYNLTPEIIVRANKLLEELQKGYDFIIYSVSREPSIPIESFLQKEAFINIVSSIFNDHEAKNWYWLLQHLGYDNINFMDIKNL